MCAAADGHVLAGGGAVVFEQDSADVNHADGVLHRIECGREIDRERRAGGYLKGCGITAVGAAGGISRGDCTRWAVADLGCDYGWR